ncbi:MAG: helix-turn-helix domain-containing protein [Rhodospirillaceae bacterium]|nr:helix-turn-helix domain-containing protein [Rhodospirillaceae bacterium]
MSSYAPVTALVRGLDVLHALNTLGGDGGVGAIHEMTGIPKPTVVRILETLIYAGFVSRISATKSYGLTAKCMALSNGFDTYDYLLRQAAPILDVLRGRLVWPSDLAVFDSNAMVIIETSRRIGTLSFNRTVGSRVPVMATAIGRCFLAFADSDTRRRILADLAVSDNPYDALARTPDQANKLLDTIRERGFATSDQEYMSSTRAIAFPIFFNGQVLATVNVFVIADAMGLDQLIDRYSPILRGAVDEIENALAGAKSGITVPTADGGAAMGISH